MIQRRDQWSEAPSRESSYSVTIGIEDVFPLADIQAFGLDALVLGIGYGLSDDPDFDALPQVALLQPGAFVAPRLTDLDPPDCPSASTVRTPCGLPYCAVAIMPVSSILPPVVQRHP